MRELLRPEWLLVFVGVITAIVIAWQALETRRSVQASREEATISRRTLVAQFRPWIRIRAIHVIEEDDSLAIEILVTNRGGTIGHILGGKVALDWIWEFSTKSSVAAASFEPISLEPGEQKPLKIILNDDWVMYRFSVDPKYSTGMRLRCEGTIIYKDDNDVARRTAFSRLRNAATQKWEIDPDPAFEYAD